MSQTRDFVSMGNYDESYSIVDDEARFTVRRRPQSMNDFMVTLPVPRLTMGIIPGSGLKLCIF